MSNMSASFFLFTHDDIKYPYALNWYGSVANSPNENTGMWIAEPIADSFAIIHLNSILCCAHTIPVFVQNSLITHSD